MTDRCISSTERAQTASRYRRHHRTYVDNHQRTTIAIAILPLPIAIQRPHIRHRACIESPALPHRIGRPGSHLRPDTKNKIKAITALGGAVGGPRLDAKVEAIPSFCLSVVFPPLLVAFDSSLLSRVVLSVGSAPISDFLAAQRDSSVRCFCSQSRAFARLQPPTSLATGRRNLDSAVQCSAAVVGRRRGGKKVCVYNYLHHPEQRIG